MKCNKGEGAVAFWIAALVGVAVVLVTYIVMDTVIFGDTNSLKMALIPLGLNMSSQPMTALTSSWNIWAVAFIAAWILALVIRAITREPNMGY